MTIKFILNGKLVQTDEDPGTPLLWVVRDTFKLKGASFLATFGTCQLTKANQT
jgi:isoquinoline 1-oxidoreductase alpha subunit